jgi:electron transfer flavoprotein beta subunit
LGIPSITTIRKAELNGNTLKVERVLNDGYEVIESSLPALVTVSHELGNLRSVNIKELMAAQKTPLTIWTANDLDLQLNQIKLNTIVGMVEPRKQTTCNLVQGDSHEEAGINLALKFKEIGLI